MEKMHINFAHFKSEISLMDYFNTEDKCKAAIAQQRWGDGNAVCPYCGSTHTHICSDGGDGDIRRAGSERVCNANRATGSDAGGFVLVV